MRTRTVEINKCKAVVVSSDGKTWVTNPQDVINHKKRLQKRYAGARWYMEQYVSPRVLAGSARVQRKKGERQ